MNKLYLDLDAMIKRIQDTGKVKMVSAEFRYFSESTAQYENAQKQQYGIPTSILQFYKEIEFAEIAWHAKENALKNYQDQELDIVGGYANIPTFEKLLLSLQNNKRGDLIDPNHAFPSNKNSLLNSFVPFDYLEGGGATCFKMENNQIKDKLYLVRSGLECFIEPLGARCRDYFLTGCKHYYFNDWQQALYLQNETLKQTMTYYLKELNLKII